MRLVKTVGYNFLFALCLLLLPGCFGMSGSSSNADELAALDSVDTIQRVAFGSCAYQFEQQPIWDVIAEIGPDLFIFAGDAIYADWNGTTTITPSVASLRASWKQLANRPHFKKFRAAVPVIAVWDNHDYGTATGGKSFSLKEQAKAAFLDFLREPKDSVRRTRSGVYTSYFFGKPGKRTQIILLDTRSFREPPPRDTRSEQEKEALGIVGRYQPDRSGKLELLGEEQWRWLAAELKRPADIRIIVSGIQVIANEKGMDEWGNYPHERQRLLHLIARTPGFVPLLLSGNVHFAELSRARVAGRCLTELTSSGLTHVSSPPAIGNRFRIGEPVERHNFGVVTIDHAGQRSVIELAIYDASRASVFSYRLDPSNNSCDMPAIDLADSN